MIYYFWFHVRLTPSSSVESFLAYWQPISLDVCITHNGLQSILFTSTREPQSFYAWADTVDWFALGWMNECMSRPASLGYVHTLESFNNFVDCYSSSNQQLA